MRKLKLQVQMTVDGFIAGPLGEMDWIISTWSEDVNQYVTALTEPVDTILLGRKLAQGFIPHWKGIAEKEAPEHYSRKFVETPKIVFTKSLENSEWEYTTLAKGDLTEEVNSVKAREGGDIIVYGGGSFVSALIREGLIDEFHLFVNPTLLGDGMPIFRELKERQALHLKESRSFDCGIVLLCYELVNTNPL